VGHANPKQLQDMETPSHLTVESISSRRHDGMSRPPSLRASGPVGSDNRPREAFMTKLQLFFTYFTDQVIVLILLFRFTAFNVPLRFFVLLLLNQ
jgi:hypothetical protein